MPRFTHRKVIPIGATARVVAQRTRPAFGWDSLADTERTITGLVARGLSNCQVASRVYLSTHTVAFHLRHVFWKLGFTSRVQLARMAAEQAATGLLAVPSALGRCHLPDRRHMPAAP
jgi:DNA-binding CsgD family transcriptional regulator